MPDDSRANSSLIAISETAESPDETSNIHNDTNLDDIGRFNSYWMCCY